MRPPFPREKNLTGDGPLSGFSKYRNLTKCHFPGLSERGNLNLVSRESYLAKKMEEMKLDVMENRDVLHAPLLLTT